MKNIRIIIDGCKDSLFNYPCIDSNSTYLFGKKVSIFTSDNLSIPDWLEDVGANVILNPSDKDVSFSDIGIIMPPVVDKDDEDGYYLVLDYYVQRLQLFVHKQKGGAYKHLIVMLPPKSDEHSTSFVQMANYAIYGLIRGLGKTYASYGLFINGIILNPVDSQMNLRDRIMLLASNNSCNIVGQIFKL